MMGDLKKHIEHFRKHIIGNDLEYITSYGTQKMLYLDVF